MRMIMYMPTKNVYVAEADLPLLDRAAELAGGVSAAVIAGIRLYLERSEREMGGFREIEVQVSDGALVTAKRFQGRRLFRLEHRDGLRVIAYEVYATARQQFAVYRRDDPDWARLSAAGDDPIWENPESWAPDFYGTRSRTLQVFPDIDAMEAELPSDVVDTVRRAVTKPAVEDLDILRRRARAMSGEDVVLQVSGLAKSYSYRKYRVPALNGVHFTLRRGEFAGLFGPNGAGKTTALKAIVGLLRPDSGEVLVNGMSIARSPAEVKSLIGYVSQDRSVMTSVTVLDELVFQARSYGYGKRAALAAADEVASELEIRDLLGREAITLSGGQRRRVEIGMALIHRPALLVLDEPTLGLDPDTRAGLWRVIERIRQQASTTILMSTHYLDEASSLMSRVIVLDFGRVVELGTTAEIIARHARGTVAIGEFAAPSEAVPVLAAATAKWPGTRIEIHGKSVLIHATAPDQVAAAALAGLYDRGQYPDFVSSRSATISDAFHAITGRAYGAE
jgi:ABC-2 type transport system ATP-binding protein